MKPIFLDSNVIANWILIADSAERLEEFRDEEILKERFENISYSYTLVEALIATEEYKVKTSNLAIGEVYHVIYNEILSQKMYRLGIPLTLWSKMREKHRLSESEKFLIKDSVSKHLRKLKKSVELVKEEVDDEIYPKLVLDYRLRTHDAILLTTAILNNCEWFITNDKEIVNLNRRRKASFSEVFKIIPDLPQNFLRVVQ